MEKSQHACHKIMADGKGSTCQTPQWRFHQSQGGSVSCSSGGRGRGQGEKRCVHAFLLYLSPHKFKISQKALVFSSKHGITFVCPIKQSSGHLKIFPQTALEFLSDLDIYSSSFLGFLTLLPTWRSYSFLSLSQDQRLKQVCSVQIQQDVCLA